jgi:hypothetical protein
MSDFINLGHFPTSMLIWPLSPHPSPAYSQPTHASQEPSGALTRDGKYAGPFS